jgi:tRNA(fMet)-specific endonuclease VapC
MILLDSSAIIEFLEESERGNRVRKFVENESSAVSVISINELLITSQGKENDAIRKLLSGMHVFDFDERSAYRSVEIEKELRKRGKVISKLDIFIAAICLVNKLSLVTLDRDFEMVDGLKVLKV